MSAAIMIRQDFEAGELRCLARTVKNANQARRLLAIAAVYEGMDREEAARIGGMDRQTLRDWVHRFNEEGPDGLINMDLKRVLGERFGVDLSAVRLGRVLKELGFSHISARPRHPAQDAH